MKKDTKVNTFTVEEKKEISQFLNDYTTIKNDKNISEKAKIVLSFLLYTGSQQDGKFTIGYDYMSEVLGISKNGISAIIGRLESKGFFTRNKGVKGKNSEYIMNYEAMNNYTPINTSSKEISTCTNIDTTCTNYLADIQALRAEIAELIQVQKQLIQVQSELLNLYLNINNNINLKKHENINYNGNNMIDHEKNILKENEINFKVDHEKENEISKDIKTNSNEKLQSSSKDEDIEISFFEESQDSNTSMDNENFKPHFENGKFLVGNETENESISSEVEQHNENNIFSESQDSNTSKDMKTNSNEKLQSSSKDEENKMTNSNTSKDMEKYNSNEDYKLWGKIQPTYDYATCKMEEYRFTVYESLHARKDYAGKYTQIKRYIDIAPDDLKSFAIPSQGTFGILTHSNGGKYSFIVADDNTSLVKVTETQNEITVKGGGEADGSSNKKTETSNNTRTSVQASQVEQLPTDAKKVAPAQYQVANTQYCYMLPTMSDLQTLTLSQFQKKIITFVKNHQNVSDEQKAYINNLCVACALSPQYTKSGNECE